MNVSARFKEIDSLYTFNTLKVASNRDNTKYVYGLDTSREFNGTPRISWESIVFIIKEGIIWTHGRVFSNSSSSPTSVTQSKLAIGYSGDFNIEDWKSYTPAFVYKNVINNYNLEVLDASIVPETVHVDSANPVLTQANATTMNIKETADDTTTDYAHYTSTGYTSEIIDTTNVPNYIKDSCTGHYLICIKAPVGTKVYAETTNGIIEELPLALMDTSLKRYFNEFHKWNVKEEEEEESNSAAANEEVIAVANALKDCTTTEEQVDALFNLYGGAVSKEDIEAALPSILEVVEAYWESQNNSSSGTSEDTPTPVVVETLVFSFRNASSDIYEDGIGLYISYPDCKNVGFLKIENTVASFIMPALQGGVLDVLNNTDIKEIGEEIKALDTRVTNQIKGATTTTNINDMDISYYRNKFYLNPYNIVNDGGTFDIVEISTLGQVKQSFIMSGVTKQQAQEALESTLSETTTASAYCTAVSGGYKIGVTYKQGLYYTGSPSPKYNFTICLLSSSSDPHLFTIKGVRNNTNSSNGSLNYGFLDMPTFSITVELLNLVDLNNKMPLFMIPINASFNTGDSLTTLSADTLSYVGALYDKDYNLITSFDNSRITGISRQLNINVVHDTGTRLSKFVLLNYKTDREIEIEKMLPKYDTLCKVTDPTQLSYYVDIQTVYGLTPDDDSSNVVPIKADDGNRVYDFRGGYNTGSLYVIFLELSHYETTIYFKGSGLLHLVDYAGTINGTTYNGTHSIIGSVPNIVSNQDYILSIKDNIVIIKAID